MSTFAAVFSLVLFSHVSHSQNPLGSISPDRVPASRFNVTTVVFPGNVPRSLTQFTREAQRTFQLHSGSFERENKLQS